MTDTNPPPGVIAIGAGNWGRNVVRTFHELGALAAVAEPSDAIRGELAEAYPDTPLYTSHAEAIAEASDLGAQAAAIATPAQTHGDVATDAIDAGLDVFVEKPITLTAVEAEALVQRADKADAVLMVGHLLLYQPAVAFIRDAIANGDIGSLRSIHQQRAKLGRVRRVENVLWSFGVHDIAVFLHLTGETPHQLDAVGQCVLQDGVADDVHLHLGFPGGVTAHLHTSWLWPETQRRMTVVGSDATLVYDEVAGTVTRHEATIGDDLQAIDNGAEIVFKADDQPLTIELDHFLECVETRRTPTSPGQQGVDVVRVLEAADKAMERDDE